MSWIASLLRRAPRIPHHVAACGCVPSKNIECAQGEALGDDAARKFQSYHAARGTPFARVSWHAWDLARSRYLRHMEEARAWAS